MRKCRFFQNVLFLLIVLILANTAYAQSIGATPKKTVEINTNTPTMVSIGVSQGALYAERITIEGDYDWLSIEEREFILQSKTKKSVKMIVNVNKPGTHIANLRICASPVSAEGAMLSTKACTPHKLMVIATGDSKTKRMIFVLVGVILGLVVFFLIYFLRKSFAGKDKKSKSGRRKIR